MIKTILNMLVGALICAAVGTAMAVVGTPPIAQGFALVDGVWLNGLAGGQNATFQSGIVAHAGGTQAACLILPSGIYYMSVDTVASTNDSVCLPFAAAGTNVQIRNAGANTLNIYPISTNNPLTGAADTINGSASTPEQPGSQTNIDCFVAKNGAWSCSKGS